MSGVTFGEGSHSHDHYFHLGDYHHFTTSAFDHVQTFQSPSLDSLSAVHFGAEVAAREFHLLHLPAIGLEVVHVAHTTKENIQTELKAGHDVAETMICNVAKGATEVGIKTIGGTLITAGVPVWAAECATNPGMLLSTPAVTHLMADSYQNLGVVSEHIAGSVEEKCHQLFDISRHLLERN